MCVCVCVQFVCMHCTHLPSRLLFVCLNFSLAFEISALYLQKTSSQTDWLSWFLLCDCCCSYFTFFNSLSLLSFISDSEQFHIPNCRQQKIYFILFQAKKQCLIFRSFFLCSTFCAYLSLSCPPFVMGTTMNALFEPFHLAKCTRNEYSFSFGPKTFHIQ